MMLLTVHLPVPFHLATVVFHLVSTWLPCYFTLLHAIPFPRVISIEQRFSSYIFKWAIYTLYYYTCNYQVSEANEILLVVDNAKSGTLYMCVWYTCPLNSCTGSFFSPKNKAFWA